jgi:hypothetical protein
MILGGETTNVGAEFYEGGSFVEQGAPSRRGAFTMFTKTIATVTNQAQPGGAFLDTGALEVQLFTEGQNQGQRPGGRQIVETIVLQGAPTQLGGPVPTPPANGVGGQPIPGRPILQAHGSVSAATPMWAALIDHQFDLVQTQNGQLLLTIH